MGFSPCGERHGKAYTMIELTEWLVSIEHAAHLFYTQAAEKSDDPDLKAFLQHVANDEAEHFHIMGSAAQYLGSRPPRRPQIDVDETLKDKIQAPFSSGMAMLQRGGILKEAVIDRVVESEYSEWNDLFLYVLNTLRKEDRIFEQAAGHVQRHMRRIEFFLNRSEYGREKLKSFTQLPYSKKERTLIVDDEDAIAQLLASLLEDLCDSDIAANGAEALDKIKANFYDLIISDVDMPVVNGLRLYQNAAPLFMHPQEVFLFHTGNLTDDSRRFFEANNLHYMTKPSSVAQIRNAVISMARRK